jgi:hypothetical protein
LRCGGSSGTSKEQEPTLSDVALAVSALGALTDEHSREAVRVLRALAGSF